ncbi:MAG: glycosyl hydrolase [Lentisphaerae bacterium]|nr:glycosyl hydrolase [Lentisphaerota bacterium]
MAQRPWFCYNIFMNTICILFAAVMSVAPTGDKVELCPLSEVRLAESSVFTPAVKAGLSYVDELDPDRLLAPFLREAGLPKKADSYGNWESCGLDGHTLGHYMSALANFIASGNDADGHLKKRLEYIVSELARCQKANGDGRCDGVPKGRELWSSIKAGDVGVIFKHWVPWYNVHKTFAGLRDAYELAGVRQARSVLVALSDWAIDLTSELDVGKMQHMLDQEFGGMNETFADVYAITGDAKYIDAARRWEHNRVFEPLYRHEDRLTGYHANTQIPKFVGLARTAQLSGDDRRWDAADFVWRTIVTRRSVAFGGNSVGEHFHALDSFAKLMADRQGPETCNTYNMLRLTERLFEHDPKPEYAAFYERALYNHLLASINTRKPGFVYFTPTRPAHYRVYSTPTNCFWCCVGTGMENPGKYGRFIYARSGKDKIYVNLFIDSELRGVLRQKTDFPDGGKTTIEFLKPFKGTLYVREGDKYAKHTGSWQKGAKITASRPMDWHVEMLPDGSDWGAVMRGPIVMGKDCGKDRLDGLFADDSRMGHVAWGPLVDADKVEFREAGKPLDTKGLVPFFKLHECRYQIYWEFTTAEKMVARKAALEAAAKAERERERRTRDRVMPGEQQPETEHDMQTSENTAKGYHSGKHWRHGSWFAYTLDPKGAKNVAIEATYWGDDRGRAFDVLANGVRLATVKLEGRHGGKFFTETYPVPPEVAALRADGKIRVTFASTNGGLAGGVFDVRLMEAQ